MRGTPRLLKLSTGFILYDDEGDGEAGAEGPQRPTSGVAAGAAAFGRVGIFLP